MKKRVFIDGSEGTTGLRIHERLSSRGDISLIKAEEEKRKEPSERKKLINSADIIFLCLPDKAAKESVSLIENENVRVIDASTAHRTAQGWIYGLPELSEERLTAVREAKRLSVPGCHATGFNVLVYPLTEMKIAPQGYPFCAHSITGYSGGGKKMIAEYGEKPLPQCLKSPRQYALSQCHKHLPEMQKTCGLSFPPVFTPIVSDYYSGMVVTVPVLPRLLDKKMTAEEMMEFFSDYYKKSKLIEVMPKDGGIAEDGFLDAAAMAGSDGLQIFVAGNDERILLISRFDNLGKGASGAAVECMNLMLGIDELKGLRLKKGS
ncbi:MAG: N-acetyl-gamma-glutamyl-phosphate reductase [Bacillota bacterium]|nr:N-acetyl-gamma-glutamyl-phosphate reductase [Bacillota bacterium]